ncbi:hypothetical protein [Leptospira adleri]|uniref:hypothetical protein n=1 Tax=Leptospira adleri TaxID=2023186 RepID=UPI001082747B|nr:hypothetical protein [Leptospira adleri]TGM61652.1 hypothetical protein EHQ97_01455 [Leptospira adleri]
MKIRLPKIYSILFASRLLILTLGAFGFVCKSGSPSEPGSIAKPLIERHRCLDMIRSLKESDYANVKENSDRNQVEIEKRRILDFIKTEWKYTEKVLPENQFVRYEVSIVDGFYCAIADRKLKVNAEDPSLQCGIEYAFKSNPFEYLTVNRYAPQCPPES